jgi:hypothetical protein
MKIYSISSHRQPERCDPPDCGLSMGLTTPHHKKPASYKMLQLASELDRCFGMIYTVENGFEIGNMVFQESLQSMITKNSSK